MTTQTTVRRTASGVKLALAAAMSALVLTACATGPEGGSTVGRYDVGAPARVAFGEVVDVTPVRVRGTDGGTGTVVGAAAGAAIGAGAASRGAESIVAGILGAIIGGVAGNAIERNATQANGFEYLVRLDNGETVALVQLDEFPLRRGTPVRVIYGDEVRVVPDVRGGYRRGRDDYERGSGRDYDRYDRDDRYRDRYEDEDDGYLEPDV